MSMAQLVATIERIAELGSRFVLFQSFRRSVHLIEDPGYKSSALGYTSPLQNL